ncbi:MAG: endonuclease/exonuclease/phosphatase family protein, partial [Flavobacteriaceae bacterium]|nr:endonuclease/exonuclease/phosphatase family protein [Flavobacteriaceae bacterium]
MFNTNEEFLLTMKGINCNIEMIDLNLDIDDYNKEFLSQISHFSNNDEENSNHCQYYSFEEFTKQKFNQKHYFSIFHLNISSLQAHIEELVTLLTLIDFEFDVIAISESKLVKGTSLRRKIDIPNYHIEHTPTESEKGGTLLYIKNNYPYKPRPDLNIYKSKELESTFIEIINQKEKNIIVGCIYKHPFMTDKEFQNDYMQPFINKLYKENKPTYLAGDFNMDLLHVENNTVVSDYFDTLNNAQFMPLINLPTRITSKSKTLIDNIFYNQFSPSMVSGNITARISDHMPQFSLIPNKRLFDLPKKHNIFKRNYDKFNMDKFVKDFKDIQWEKSPTIMDSNVDNALDDLMDKTEQLLNTHAPMKKVTNREYKKQLKPWITKGILRSIQKRNKLYAKFVRAKDEKNKETIYTEFKQLKNAIINLIRKSKNNYYNRYFSENKDNTKKLWQGINEIIDIKNKKMAIPNCIIDDKNKIITESKDIA